MRGRAAPTTPVAVKVENLARKTREEDLRARLRQFPIVSFKLVECPLLVSVNYAYLNCQDRATARKVVDVVHQRMLLHSNLLTAKIKEDGRSRHFSYPAPHSGDQPSQLSSKDIKVIKILIHDSRTTGKDLNDYFETTYGQLSSHIIIRQGSPHYAYVNFMDSSPAQEARVTSQHTINGLPVTALPYKATRRTTTTKDINAVKILIYDATTTGMALDDYFTSSYGELSSQTIIRQGSPRYAYVNFIDPLRAQEARFASTHNINGISMTAVPYKATRGVPPTNPVKELMSMDFTCDPLAVGYVDKELTQHFRDQQMMKIITKSDKFTVHVQATNADTAREKVLSTIETHESNIKLAEVELDFFYLPVLADQATLKKILKINIPFGLKVSRGREHVPLVKLFEDYSKGSNGSPDNKSLKLYLTSPKEEDIHYQWHWFDDGTYQPYSKEVNQRIEEEFKHRGTFTQEICKCEYIINTRRMKQTNKTTNRESALKRSRVSPSKRVVITLQLRVCKDHIQELQREIVEGINGSIQERTLTLPDTATQTRAFVDHLIARAKKNFVRATLEEDSSLVIRGTRILVNSTEAELHKDIQKKARDMERMSQLSVPSNWEPQEGKCELKSLARQSSEWNEVKKKVLLTDCGVEIIKIERIQNTWLWEVYQQSTKQMSCKNKGAVNELMLFHGTQQTPPKDIYDSEQGFDSCLSSRGIYGMGTHFAVKFEYSHRYAHTLSTGHEQIFLAKVITGIPCECKSADRSLRAPPKKSEYCTPPGGTLNSAGFEGEIYDSVSAETSGCKIYVVHETGRVYPAYLVTYKTFDEEHTHKKEKTIAMTN